MPSDLLLEMRGITKAFPGVVANRDIDLAVKPGEVHGLLGENGAGKTTLMKILYGLVQPDQGSIAVRGNPVVIANPRDALRLGIGMVHQHFMLVPDMTVAENIALGLREGRTPLTRLGKVSQRVEALSKQYGFNLEPDDVVGSLSLGRRQRTEIRKLLYRGADLLILDEPTAVLTPTESNELFSVLRLRASQGRSTIFITHKLDELIAVADRCTVLRDGKVIGSLAKAEMDQRVMARMMVGRDVVLRVPRLTLQPGVPVLEATKLSLTAKGGRPVLRDLTFAVREREILGVAGVDGNGQQELVEVLAGLVKPTAGGFTVHGSAAVIPADRHGDAIALSMTLSDNLVMTDIAKGRFRRRGLVRGDEVRRHGRRLMTEYDIRAPDLKVRASAMSGGNQQKTVLARSLYRQPRLLIAAQPTRGLDVGAIEYVYQKILDHKRAGGGTLLISTELEEILSLSDRVAVMVGGRLVAMLDIHDVDLEKLGLLMAGAVQGPERAAAS